MKKTILLFLASLFIFASILTPASAAKKEYYEYNTPYVTEAPIIDGVLTDDAWQQAEWAEVDQMIEDSPAWGNIPAKFKVLHDGKYIYFAAEVMDDTIAEWDGVGIMFSDVRADSPKLGPNNIISFKRRNSEFVLETGVGKNGDFSAPQREGDNLVSVVSHEMKMITDDGGSPIGYVVEAKLEYLVTFPERVYFNVQWGNDETDYAGDSSWNPYWSWNLLSISTACYGELVFLEEGHAPVVTEPPVTTEPPVVTEDPDTTEAPDATETPDATEIPENSETAGATNAPVTTEPSSNETEGDGDSSKPSPILWIALAAAVVVIVAVVVFTKLRKKS